MGLRIYRRIFLRDSSGQTMAEYAIVLSVIVIATIAVFAALGGGIKGEIQSVVDAL